MLNIIITVLAQSIPMREEEAVKAIAYTEKIKGNHQPLYSSQMRAKQYFQNNDIRGKYY